MEIQFTIKKSELPVYATSEENALISNANFLDKPTVVESVYVLCLERFKDDMATKLSCERCYISCKVVNDIEE